MAPAVVTSNATTLAWGRVNTNANPTRRDGSATKASMSQKTPYAVVTNFVPHIVRGVIAGFRTPVYEKGISVPGCHVHFIDDDRTGGGHVLDFKLKSGVIEICPGTDLQLRLPLSEEFSGAELAPEDLDAQIHATEVKD